MKRVKVLALLWALALLAFPGLIGAAKPRLELKLTGGVGHFAVGDANRYLQSLSDSWNEAVCKGDLTKEGELNPVNTGSDWSAELQMELGKHFSLGIGTGFLQVRRGEETLVIDNYHQVNRFTFGYNLSAIPVKAILYYDFALGSRLRAFVGSGIGYYFGRWSMLEATDYDIHASMTSSSIRTWAHSGSIGFHGVLGLEWKLGERIALVAEGSYRFLEMDGFKGTRTWNPNPPSSVGTDTREGTLYYYETTPNSPCVELLEDPPQNDYPLGNLRQAKADFSGLSLRVGIQIPLGKS